ncbi:acetoin utilization protein AcuC [Sedimentitalea arenosa]|uniref:Acetoin utilization protein AcuC n=1 Tax=Sedimentitalea arenosa TaxID=2798803 RepID=A0A8J7J5L6_9RHOB|nr:acetoin utilization protein AcuC [Arenibacterium arenosum]MBJ6370537.1 acetoin utilization protein AcuC [Arenibacterium arenosum]
MTGPNGPGATSTEIGVSPTAPVFIGSNVYRGSSYGGSHPLAIPRVPTVTDLCRALGWLPPDSYRTSPRAKPQALTTFHTADYIAALQRAEERQQVDDTTRRRHGLGTVSNPVYPQMYRRPATSAGGVLMAAEMIARGGVAYVPGGGTHHGMADRANGFCFLNDPVLGILHLRALGLRRIIYVDIDAHHCDGVEEALAGMKDLRIVSIHEEGRWPFTGALTDTAGGIAFNLPVPRELNDTEYDLILDRFLLPAVDSFRPDAIVLQCGADALLEDPLSRLALSNTCHWRTVAALAAMTNRYLVLGGGGYNPWSVGRCWAGVWATLAGHDIPETLPDRAQQVLRALTWTRGKQRTPPAAWMRSLRDPSRPGAIRPEIRDRVERLRQRFARQV